MSTEGANGLRKGSTADILLKIQGFSVMPSHLFPITPTPDDSWVIRWIGDICPIPGSDGHEVRVLLSRLDPNFRGKPSIENEACFAEGSRLKPEEAWVPVGAFAALRIGTVWKDHELVTELPAEVRTVTFNPKAKGVYLYKVRGGPEGTLTGAGPGGYSLPASVDETYCYVVSLPGKGKQRLIIPCAELARFYFFRTRNLANKIIAGTVKYPSARYIHDPNDLYDVKETRLIPGDDGTPDRKVFVQMRSGSKITGDPQWNDPIVAARIHFEEAFRQEAWRVISNLRLRHVNDPGRPRVLKTRLPLAKPTTLTVQYKEFKDGGFTKILVLRILGCSAEILNGLPLEYSADNYGGNPAENRDELPPAFEGAKHPHFERDKPTGSDQKRQSAVLTSEDSEPNWVFPYDMTHRDAGFRIPPDRKPMLRPRKEAMTASHSSGPTLPMPSTVSANEGHKAGTGAAQTNVRATGAPEPADRKPPIPASLKTFRELLELLQARGFRTRWVVGQEAGLDPAPCGEANFLPETLDPDTVKGRVWDLHKIEAWAQMITTRGRKGTRQRRRIWIAEVTIPPAPDSPFGTPVDDLSARMFYLVEVDKRKAPPKAKKDPESYKAIECHRIGFAPLDAIALLDLAEQILRHRTTKIGPDESQSVVRHFHKHSWGTMERYMANILKEAGLAEWIPIHAQATQAKKRRVQAQFGEASA